MNVLVACEESQEVCKAFREKGHNAFSADLQKCSGGFPKWHIVGDVLPILNGHCVFITQSGKMQVVNEWDLIIAHPPCTDLSVSGARWFEEKRANGSQRKSIEFFAKFLELNCKKVVIENPINIISGDYIKKWFPDLCNQFSLPIKPAQIIQPWMFGDNFSKSTCLWLKGVQPLIPEITDEPQLEWFEWVDKKTGKIKRQNMWYKDAWKLPPGERSRIRSKTFSGIARAMAEQWGNV